jgi:hypothetical protein
VNPLLAGRKVAVGFKAPWNFLYEFNSKFDFRRDLISISNVPKGRENTFCTNFLPLLNEVRTFFKDNPDFKG